MARSSLVQSPQGASLGGFPGVGVDRGQDALAEAADLPGRELTGPPAQLQLRLRHQVPTGVVGEFLEGLHDDGGVGFGEVAGGHARADLLVAGELGGEPRLPDRVLGVVEAGGDEDPGDVLGALGRSQVAGLRFDPEQQLGDPGLDPLQSEQGGLLLRHGHEDGVGIGSTVEGSV